MDTLSAVTNSNKIKYVMCIKDEVFLVLDCPAYVTSLVDSRYPVTVD